MLVKWLLLPLEEINLLCLVFIFCIGELFGLLSLQCWSFFNHLLLVRRGQDRLEQCEHISHYLGVFLIAVRGQQGLQSLKNACTRKLHHNLLWELATVLENFQKVGDRGITKGLIWLVSINFIIFWWLGLCHMMFGVVFDDVEDCLMAAWVR